MENLHIGDIVTRKSYGGDLYFKIIDIRKKEDGSKLCILRGVMYRIEADANMEDLLVQNARQVLNDIQREMTKINVENYRVNNYRTIPVFGWMRGRAGIILHMDASSDFLNRCIESYKAAGIRSLGKIVKESDQPVVVKRLLEQVRPDILVLTGHDSMKKNTAGKNSIDSYSNSKYFIEAVKIARKYQPDKDKLCIFAGACQSYYEAIMEQGANFASSPGRILIHALDPAIISEKIALTDDRKIVLPSDVIPLTKSGKEGIGGIATKGRYRSR